VLALLVLVTGLVLAFLSRAISNRQVSAHSANTIRAERLARGAVDTVLGDLKQEIAAGTSAPIIEFHNGTLFATYVPATARSAFPYPTESSRPANLVKWSSAQPFFDSSAEFNGQPVFPNATAYPPSQRASTDATTTPSRNGRFVSPARWNRALLLPKANPSATDPSPAVTGNNSFQIPTWIYVGRNGGNPQQANVNVIGRFAYAVYDAGGLLDMNVAGYPADASGMPAEAQTEPVGRKGILAAADLTRIGLSAGDSQTLVGWRNRSTLTAGEDRYLELSLEHPNGHLTVGGNGTTSDRAFPSRQSLIDFALKQLSGGSVAQRQNYLRFLGTFSRDLDTPSWVPNPARPKILGSGASNPRDAVLSDGGNMAVGLDDEFNPALPMVRVQHPFERLSGVQARVGEPLVKNRFPLERLSWITSDGPSADLTSSDPRYNDRGTGDNIRVAFGLTWDNAANAWSYGVTSSGTPFGGRDSQRILRLEEVASLSASEAREPDFFELMQAAIHVGSLGRGFAYYRPDRTTGPFRQEEREFGWAGNPSPPELLSTQPKYQVLQIGANIIDQNDSDSFPTEIRLNGFRFFGIEDLPYLSRVMMAAQIQDEPAPPSLGSWINYVVPELWNPHDTGQASPVPPESPTQFRVTVSPTNATGVLYNWKASSPPFGPTTPPGFPQQAQNPLITYQPVSYDFSASSSDFREPAFLPASGTLTPAPPATPRMERAIPVGGFEFVSSGTAVSCRKTWPSPVETIANQTIPATYPSSPPEPTTVRNVNQVKTISRYDITLSYRRGGQWREYFTYSGLFGSQFPVRRVDQPFPAVSVSPLPQQALWDPRSGRFPSSRDDGGDSTLWSNLRPDLGAGRHRQIFFNAADNSLVSGWWKTGTPQAGGINASTAFLGTVSINSANAANVGARNTYYHDPDGVVRGADGVYETQGNYAGQPLALNANVSGGRNFSRPIILNRPFRSVGELGYVFRDAPWKTLDFFTANSGDSALLDIFCLKEPTGAGLRAGVINPNTRNAEVLEAMIAGTLKDETPLSGTGTAPVPLLNAQSTSLAQALVSTTQSNPMQNRAELVTRFVGSPTAFPLSPSSTDDAIVKRRREAVVRAMTDVSTTRVWNLMIDIIAQTGRSVNGGFIVEGERRYWVHVAIDRYTGEVLERSSELVVE
jgi:hypothetical protein